MRVYKKKTDRGSTPKDVFETAADLVLQNSHNKNYSIRQISKEYKIHYSTLSRYIKKKKRIINNETGLNTLLLTCGYQKPRRVFTENQESKMCEYIIRASDIMFGLTTKEIRHLAYQCATEFGIAHPSSWENNECAGIDWLQGFLKRHPSLCIRQPEATSIGRATSFNKTNVNSFFEKLDQVYGRTNFTAGNIYNMDETCVPTVLKPNKIVTKKGVKQVGTITSAERGEMITMAVAVNAIGNAIPPMFLYPRKKFHDHFIRDGPTGCIGTANGSGWMTEADFLAFMKHFIKFAKPTKENPVLLLLDNHSSHLSIPVLDLCRENNVVLLSFPPHCSHKLQPLDLTVFGPFKKLCSSALNSWLKTHPGKTISIHDLAGISVNPFLGALTPANIISGFAAAGIFPYNPDKFTDADFTSAYVTDRLLVEQEDAVEAASTSQSDRRLLTEQQNVAIASTSKPDTARENTPLPSPEADFSPEFIRPFPKAGPRKVSLKGRKKRRSAILTDTEERNKIHEEKLATKRKNPAKKRSDSLRINSKTKHKDYFCLVCKKKYQTKEEWVQCTKCKQWAHFVQCANGDPCYVCHLCKM